jgi:ATP-dependent helicase HrpB
MTKVNRTDLPTLPVSEVLGSIVDVLAEKPNLVLVAPPGAGKTTLVPLVLLHCPWREGRRIIVLEPRRLAARAAARRMAQLLGEQVGQQVGYRVRFDSKVSQETRIEVVTEGVFNRMLADDPGLETVAAVVFDEFHERSLDGDLALALCLDLQGAIRDDLRLIAMSATLDGAAVADLMDATVIESQGRSFPVDIIHRERMPRTAIESAMVDVILQEMSRVETRSVLAFLPGQREIEYTASLLENRLPEGVQLHRLYGALPQRLQDAALAGSADGERKVVLSSAIAETSLTIEGVTTVIDSGLARLPVFEPSTGLTRLQTVRASRASVTQRAGRAGRLGPGRAVRLWRAEQTTGLPPHAPPEILNSDLAPLLLALTDWGVNDPGKLKWLDKPPRPALLEARNLLQDLGALDAHGKLTGQGRAIAKLSLPPRHAHMVLQASAFAPEAGRKAAQLSLLVQERGVGGMSVDLDERLQTMVHSRDGRSKRLLDLARSLAKRAVGAIPPRDDFATQSSLPSSGILLAAGFPDRIARRRGPGPNGTVRYRLANGRGAEIDATHGLSSQDFLVVVDMAGRAGAARILSAAAIKKPELERHFSDRLDTFVETTFDPETRLLTAKSFTKLGAVVVGGPRAVKLDTAAIRFGLREALDDYGTVILPWRDPDLDLRSRLALLHRRVGGRWPDVAEAKLLERVDEWLMPFLNNATRLDDLADGSLSNGLLLLAGHPSANQLESLVPTHFVTPSGSRIGLVYDEETVKLSVRPQELFSLDRHPAILNGTLPMDVELVSPAGRPIQITRDLPGFWRGSWREVRADLRGRYPKHPWPENALAAAPTSRAKPRKR